MTDTKNLEACTVLVNRGSGPLHLGSAQRGPRLSLQPGRNLVISAVLAEISATCKGVGAAFKHWLSVGASPDPEAALTVLAEGGGVGNADLPVDVRGCTAEEIGALARNAPIAGMDLLAGWIVQVEARTDLDERTKLDLRALLEAELLERHGKYRAHRKSQNLSRGHLDVVMELTMRRRRWQPAPTVTVTEEFGL